MSTQYDPSKPRAPQSFSWGRLIADMKLRGIPAMIACNCEPTHYDATDASKPFLRLELLDAMKAMQHSPSMDQLKEALTEYFGENLQIEVVLGPALRSQSTLAGAKRITSQVIALETVMNDKLVQDMIKNFGAQILVESVDQVAQPSALAARKPG